LESADTKTPDTVETLKPVDKGTPDKGKSREAVTPSWKAWRARRCLLSGTAGSSLLLLLVGVGVTASRDTREINTQRASVDPDSRVPEHLLQEVIQELENERRAFS
jgi:hypothetical protein